MRSKMEGASNKFFCSFEKEDLQRFTIMDLSKVGYLTGIFRSRGKLWKFYVTRV